MIPKNAGIVTERTVVKNSMVDFERADESYQMG